MASAYENIGTNVTNIARETAIILDKSKQEIIQNVTQNITGSIVNPQNYAQRYIYEPATSGLPVLYLTGNIAAVTKNNKVDFSYKFGSVKDGYKEGTCQVKWQGNSSLNFRKKNYTLSKMSPVLDVGWGNHNKYVLKANFSDPSYARNVCTAKLWGDVVRSRTTGGEVTTKLKTLPNGGAVDGFPIILFINDEYKGIHTFNIPKDDYLFGMSADNECFICNESGTDATLFKGHLDKEGLLSERSGLSIGWVPDEDNIDWVITSFNNMVDVVKDLDNSNYKEVIADYIEIQSFIDSMLFHYMTGNGDVVAKNSLNGTYNGVKWFRSVYDLDQAFGGHWQGLRIVKPNGIPSLSTFTGNKIWWLIYKYDKALLKSRYEELRNGAMSEYNVFDKFSNFVVQIPKALVNEENIIWYDQPLTGIDPVSCICNWYRLRCQYMDAEIESL